MVFNGKGECRFWFIRTMAFEYFVVLIQIVFIVNCFRSGIKNLASQKVVLGSLHCFLLIDFIAFFRIVFSVKCRSTEDIGIYLWFVKKNASQPATQKHAETLLIFVDHTILWQKSCPLQSFSLLRQFVDEYLHHIVTPLKKV